MKLAASIIGLAARLAATRLQRARDNAIRAALSDIAERRRRQGAASEPERTEPPQSDNSKPRS